MAATEKHSQVCTIVTHLTAPTNEHIPAFTAHLVKIMMTGARCNGFWSGEMIAPSIATHGQWVLIQRFESHTDATAWQESETRRKLIEDVPAILKGATEITKDEITKAEESEVSTAILTEILPGMEEDFFHWQSKIQIAQSRHPGYHSHYLQPPIPGRPGKWSTLLRFNSPSDLESWFESEERKELVHEAESFVKGTRIIQDLSNAFPGWIPLDEKGKSPPNWKTALLVLLGLFPVVIFQQIFVTPHLMSINLVLRSFMNLIGSVAATSFVTMPFFVSKFKWWLFPDGNDKAATRKGVVILLGLFAVEIMLFLLIEKIMQPT